MRASGHVSILALILFAVARESCLDFARFKCKVEERPCSALQVVAEVSLKI